MVDLPYPPRDDSQLYIRTFTNKKLWPLNPKPEDIDIRDIAHGLAHECRYAGQTLFHYSVAQHSILVASAFNNVHDRLEALLHDASEAYIKDLPIPLKRIPELKAVYEQIEGRVTDAIREHFGLWNYVPVPNLDAADKAIVALEKLTLFPGIDPKPTLKFPFATAFPIERITPEEAERRWLNETTQYLGWCRNPR